MSKFLHKFLYKGVNKVFKPNTAHPERESAEAVAAQQGRAQNMTMAADNWLADPERARQQEDFMSALRSQLGDVTNRGFADTSRSTLFGTARQGLTGGRVDVDRQNQNLRDLFQRRIGNEAQVQDAGNSLRTGDFNTRQNLINSAYGVSNLGQGAIRSDATSYADGPDWAKLAYGAGQDIAGGVAKRQQNQAFLDALKGSTRGGPTGYAPTKQWSLGPTGFGGDQ